MPLKIGVQPENCNRCISDCHTFFETVGTLSADRLDERRLFLTRGRYRGRLLLGRCVNLDLFELDHSTNDITQLGPHEEAAAVSTRPGAFQDGLRTEGQGCFHLS